MTAASALVTSFEAAPQLAENAVRQALENCGLARANGVILFLSADFARHSRPAVLAAARASGCLQVIGMVASGLFTEAGWVLDKPAAAAMVIGNGFSLAPRGAPLLSFNGDRVPPAEWRGGVSRIGLSRTETAVWQQGRLIDGHAEAAVAGARCHFALSAGLSLLGMAQCVDRVKGHELSLVSGQTALESLKGVLPPEVAARHPLPIHLLGIVRDAAPYQAIPLLAVNADASVTLAEPLRVGESIRWTARQPDAAEADMNGALERLAADCPAPSFGLMLSCIGRGPFFYGHEDRDLELFRRRFPGLPVLGAYGNGQIVPLAGENRELQNSVLTALFEIDSHV